MTLQTLLIFHQNLTDDGRQQVVLQDKADIQMLAIIVPRPANSMKECRVK